VIRVRVLAAAGGAALTVALGITSIAPGRAAAESLDPKVKPDATLAAGQSAVFTEATPHYGAEVLYPPHSCRGEARTLDDNAAPFICKSYRVALNLDPNPKALNTVIFEAVFQQTQAPSLPLVALGLNPPPAGGVNVYVWDKEDHYLGQDATTDVNDPSPGGASFNDPEIGSFTAKQRLYDITVQAEAGPNNGFDLHVTFSNEIFKKPFEVLDENTFAPPSDNNATPFIPPADTATPTAPPLPPATITPDRDIAGIGLGTDEQFGRGAFALPPQTRTIASTNPPSTLVLVVGMIGLPFVVGVAAVVLMRRRRLALLA
jgi:hypothetical protein